MNRIEILQEFRPMLGAPSFDDGGREVVGWLHCSRWRALLGWAELLLDRNIHGTLPFATNPEPWPGYYWAVENAESSHLASPWFWGELSKGIAQAVAMARTLRDVRRAYPQATPDQIEDVLLDLDLI